MDRTFNSIGSNIFFEFGKQEEFVFPNGKKGVEKQWAIWLSWTSWRISQRNLYIGGSGGGSEIKIQTHLDQLLGLRFRSFQFLSRFLDVEFHFENGYKVTTFFNYITENQWLLFLPDKTDIVIDCSSEEAIKAVKKLSQYIHVQDKYKAANFSLPVTKVEEVAYGPDGVPKFVGTNGFSLELGSSAWRLEKNDEYYTGRLDYYFGSREGHDKEFKSKLSELVGKRIKHVDMDHSRMDARFQFEGGYVLEVFTHSSIEPWRISYKGDVILSAHIDLVDG